MSNTATTEGTPPEREPPSRRKDAGGHHERRYEFLLAGVERRWLPRLARMLPRRVMPDHLSLLGVFAATAVGVCYLLANRHPGWLWGASAFLVLQWYGDSLDGTLARVRGIERPRYGYYLDHLVDAYSTVVIGIGLGLSPYMLLSVGLAIVIAYLLLSINVYLETHVYREFSFGYGRVGPTEVRLIMIAVNVTAFLAGPLRFELYGEPIAVFDLFGLAVFGGMLSLLSARAFRNLKRLARLEPPGVRRRNVPEGSAER
ncbi:MAG: CDP-alcohol phosphatidyltransferase family protein [Gemmatimonadota bacterium]|nr:CDP-alcohol phosphatidyltransferase family protein [Gemmatimonadota bacterium]